MDLETVSAPAVEPLTLAEARRHLRIEDGGDDVMLEGLISAARAQVEAFTKTRLITQTVRFTLHRFPRRISIPVWPVQSISQIEYTAEDGTDTVLAASEYTLVKGRAPREIVPGYEKLWPDAREHYNAVRVDVVVGHGSTGDAIPPDLRVAMLLVLGAMYEHREDVVADVSLKSLPGTAAAEAKMWPHVFYGGA